MNPSQHFHRDGINIRTNHYITVTEAILGCNLTVRTVYGKSKIEVEPGTSDGTEIILKK